MYMREREGIFPSDTTWCDAYQSLLSTWMRNQELNNGVNFTNLALRGALSLKMWDVATFDVAMRLLHKFS